MKKLIFALGSILMFGLSSCSYKTCPTYADHQPEITKVTISEQV